MEHEQRKLLHEVLKSSFCGRFSGKWSDVSSDAGAVWALVQKKLREAKTDGPAPTTESSGGAGAAKP